MKIEKILNIFPELEPFLNYIIEENFIKTGMEDSTIKLEKDFYSKQGRTLFDVDILFRSKNGFKQFIEVKRLDDGVDSHLPILEELQANVIRRSRNVNKAKKQIRAQSNHFVGNRLSFRIIITYNLAGLEIFEKLRYDRELDVFLSHSIIVKDENNQTILLERDKGKPTSGIAKPILNYVGKPKWRRYIGKHTKRYKRFKPVIKYLDKKLKEEKKWEKQNKNQKQKQ